MSYVILPVESEDLLEQVYRFRYRIYVEEMQRVQKYADHAHKRIEEPLDKGGRILAAFHEGEIVGTLRCNFAKESDLGFYSEFYKINKADIDDLSAVSVTTKLMVAPAFRGGTLAARLATAIYKVALESGIQYDFIDCNAHLEQFFARLGYVKYCQRVFHPEYGNVQPMLLRLLNIHHMDSVRSPFCSILRSSGALRYVDAGHILQVTS